MTVGIQVNGKCGRASAVEQTLTLPIFHIHDQLGSTFMTRTLDTFTTRNI